jgi:RNA polymerase sigma factor (sigma-70 family)
MVALLSASHLPSILENVGGWLYTLVRRRCVDLLRRASSRRSDEREAALEELFDATPDASAQLEQRELVASVTRALRMMDEPLRFAFVENALEGKTFKEISRQSGIPMGTLMARKQRAVEEIRNELRQRGLMPPQAMAKKEKVG